VRALFLDGRDRARRTPSGNAHHEEDLTVRGTYSKEFIVEPGATDIVLKDENNGGGEADFDSIQLRSGFCPNLPPTNLCTFAVPPGCSQP
jgi:hypothetical protein